MTTTSRTLTRRRILTHGASGLSALALGTAAFPSWAQALAGDKKKKLTADQIAAIEARHSEGSATNVLDAKLGKHAKRLSNLLLHKGRHAVALAAAHPTASFQQSSIHLLAAKRIAKLGSVRATRAKVRATKILSASSAVMTEQFGAYAKAELASATVKQAPDLELSAIVREMVEQLGKQQEAADKDAKKKDDKDEPIYTRYEFELNSVKCLEENDPTSPSDELLIGGHLINRDGSTTEIKQIKYESFDKGDKYYKDYEACDGVPADDAAWLEKFGLCPHGNADNVYRGRKIIGGDLPGKGTYGLLLMLGEQDTGGGFGAFVQEVYDKLKTEIQALLMDAGYVVGAALSTWLGPIGEAIGVALAWALGKLVEWFVGLFDNKDDFIAAKSWSIELASRKQSDIKSLSSDELPTPKGVWASPIKKLDFEGKDDSGHYEVRLHWRAFAS